MLDYFDLECQSCNQYADAFMDFLKELDSYIQIPSVLPGVKALDCGAKITSGSKDHLTVKSGCKHEIGDGSHVKGHVTNTITKNGVQVNGVQADAGFKF